MKNLANISGVRNALIIVSAAKKISIENHNHRS